MKLLNAIVTLIHHVDIVAAVHRNTDGKVELGYLSEQAAANRFYLYRHNGLVAEQVVAPWLIYEDAFHSEMSEAVGHLPGGFFFGMAINGGGTRIRTGDNTTDLIWGSTMQPLGAALAVIALTWCVGRAGTLEKMRSDSGPVVPVFLFYWIKYVIPAAILLILVFGWVNWSSQR